MNKTEYQRAYYARNRDRLLAASKQRYAENPEPAKARAKRQRVEDPARKKALDAAYRERNREAIDARVRAWKANNPERAKELHIAQQARRRARKRAAPGTFTAEDVQELLAEQNGICGLCPALLPPYHVDHKVPLAKGGSNDRTNIQLLCPTCNLRKGAKLLPAGGNFE